MSTKFYFGDERCVAKDHKESNYYLVKNAFNYAIDDNNLIGICGNSIDHIKEAEKYARTLPKEIDIALFSVGEDGHIASIFPSSSLFRKAQSLLYF